MTPKASTLARKRGFASSTHSHSGGVRPAEPTLLATVRLAQPLTGTTTSSSSCGGAFSAMDTDREGGVALAFTAVAFHTTRPCAFHARMSEGFVGAPVITDTLYVAPMLSPSAKDTVREDDPLSVSRGGSPGPAVSRAELSSAACAAMGALPNTCSHWGHPRAVEVEKLTGRPPRSALALNAVQLALGKLRTSVGSHGEASKTPLYESGRDKTRGTMPGAGWTTGMETLTLQVLPCSVHKLSAMFVFGFCTVKVMVGVGARSKVYLPGELVAKSP